MFQLFFENSAEFSKAWVVHQSMPIAPNTSTVKKQQYMGKMLQLGRILTSSFPLLFIEHLPNNWHYSYSDDNQK